MYDYSHYRIHTTLPVVHANHRKRLLIHPLSNYMNFLAFFAASIVLPPQHNPPYYHHQPHHHHHHSYPHDPVDDIHDTTRMKKHSLLLFRFRKSHCCLEWSVKVVEERLFVRNHSLLESCQAVRVIRYDAVALFRFSLLAHNMFLFHSFFFAITFARLFDAAIDFTRTPSASQRLFPGRPLQQEDVAVVVLFLPRGDDKHCARCVALSFSLSITLSLSFSNSSTLCNEVNISGGSAVVFSLSQYR
jgi:hypothetical protein